MLTRYCNQHRFAQAFILAFAFLVFGGAEAFGQSTSYSGNGNNGFGGALGTGSFDISDDGTTVTLTFNRGSGNFNDALVVYIDSESGGPSNTSNFTDTGDPSRQAVSGYNGSSRSTVNFPVGFRPDFAISANVNGSDPNFNNLFDLAENGSHTFVDGVNINPSSGVGNSTYTMKFDFSEINTSSGTESFSFVATYLNEGSAFRSDEAIGDGISGGNPGSNPVTFDTYFQYSSGDEGGLAATAATGDWSNAATWMNGNVPLSGDDVEINHDVTLDTDATVRNLTVANGNTFTGSDGTNGYTLTVTNGGTLTNNGTFTASDGKFVFSGSGTVSGTVGFNNVDISGGVNFGSSSTVNGILSIKGGGFADTNAPTYADGSTLEFDTGGSYTIGGSTTLWVPGNTRGEGVPDNVEVSSTSPLNIFGARDVTGNLTINSSGSVKQGNNVFIVQGNLTNSGTYSFVSDGSENLDIEGNFTNKSNASFTLSPAIGGDMRVAGNFEVENNSTFEDNGRLVDFDGETLSTPAQQEVTGSGIDIAFLEVNNSSGVVLNTNITTTGELTLTTGQLTTNGNLTLTSSSETNTTAIAGSGSGSVSGDVTFERFLDKSDDASHFRFLSAPTATKLDDEGSGSNAGNLLSNMWTQSETGTGADAAVSDLANASVYAYNEAADLNDGSPNLANGWESIGQSNGSWGEVNDLSALPEQSTAAIDPGRGFLTFMFADQDFDGTNEGFPLTLSATGSVQAQENNGSAINPPIDFTSGDGDGTSNNGWNLIANPFMAPIDWESIENDGNDLTNVDKTIYVWDPSANSGDGAYATYTADSGTGGAGTQDQYIAPFQAFFVKATGSSPSIGGIDSGDKATGQNPQFKSNDTATPQITLQLRAEEDSKGETTAFRYAEDASAGKDAYDAYQLEPLSASRTLVASEMDGTDALFDHQNRPVPAEVDTVDLALDITEGGTYTLEASALENLPGDWNVVLENTDTGTRYDVDAGETVTFDVTPPESAPKSESSSSPVAAMLENGGPTVATAKKSSSDLPSFRLLVGPSSAIPVELASFDATTEGTEVQLSWQTASETNNAGFAVERKTQDGAWSQIGFREGAGTTSEAQTYRFADAEVPFEAEQVRYRLRQKDLDGTTTLSDEVTVELGAPSKARLHAPFPNPAAQQATVRYEVPKTTTVQIAVYDVLGRRVETVVDGQVPAGRAQATVQTGQWAPGAYFVRMQLGDTVHTKRLSVVR